MVDILTCLAACAARRDEAVSSRASAATRRSAQSRSGNFAPGQHGKSRKQKLAGYGVQLREKQKVKRIYGVLEDQFRRYFEQSGADARESPARRSCSCSERRLDTVTYRAGFATSRAQCAPDRSPRALHRERPQGGHSIFLAQAGRRRRGEAEQPARTRHRARARGSEGRGVAGSGCCSDVGRNVSAGRLVARFNLLGLLDTSCIDQAVRTE